MGGAIIDRRRARRAVQRDALKNEAWGRPGCRARTGASRTAGPGGQGANGGNSQGGAIYLAAGTPDARRAIRSRATSPWAARRRRGYGRARRHLLHILDGREFSFEGFVNGGVGGTGGKGGIGAGGALYIAGGNVIDHRRQRWPATARSAAWAARGARAATPA